MTGDIGRAASRLAGTDRHLIVHVVQHQDGSLSTRQWTPIEPPFAEEFLAILGGPNLETHLPAEACTRLAPVMAQESVVINRDTER